MDPALEVFAWLKDSPLFLPKHPSRAQSHGLLVRVQLEYDLYAHKLYPSDHRLRRRWLLAALIYLHTIIATPCGWHLLPKMEAHLIDELKNLLEDMSNDSEKNQLGADMHL
jgi:hypothetical protein